MFKVLVPIIKTLSFPLLLKVGTALVGLLFNYIATQTLSTEEFGLFTIAQLVVIILVTLSKFGLDTAIVKSTALKTIVTDYSKDQSKICLNYTILLLVALFSLIVSILLYLFGELFFSSILNKTELNTLILPIALLILPNAITAINSGILRGANHASLSLLFSGLATLSLASVIALLNKPSSALSLIYIVLLANYIICITSLIITFYFNQWRCKPLFSALSVTLKSSASLWVVALVALIIQQFSTLILAKYANSADLGIYAIATKIAVLMSFFLVAINSVYAPKFAQLFATNQIEPLKALVAHIQKILIVVAIISVLFIFLTAPYLMAFFGQDYIKGTIWLQILIAGQFVNLATGANVNLLIMTGHEKTHRNNTILIAIITLILGFILIPRYHALGAALTTAIAMACQNLLSYYFAQKKVFYR